MYRFDIDELYNYEAFNNLLNNLIFHPLVELVARGYIIASVCVVVYVCPLQLMGMIQRKPSQKYKTSYTYLGGKLTNPINV